MFSKLNIVAIIFFASTATAESPAGNPKPDRTNAPDALQLQRYSPSWLRVSVEERIRMEAASGADYLPDVSDTYLLNRLRLLMRLQPVPWFRIHLQAQDARAWGMNVSPAPTSAADSFDLRQLSMELGTEGGHAGLHAGRQPIHFGDGRLIGDSGWSNVGRTFDAARLTFRGSGLQFDVFSGSPVQIRRDALNRSDWKTTIHGGYLTAARLLPGTSLEPYFFVKRQTAGKPLDLRTAGARWAGKLPRPFDFNFEGALQSGHSGAEQVAAWAWHSAVGFTWKARARDVRIFGEYNAASGDKDAHDTRRGTFDPLYPSVHDRFGLLDQLSWSNIQNVQQGVEYAVSRRLSLKGGHNSFWLAQSHDGLYRGGQLFLRPVNGGGGQHIGEEFDLQTTLTLDARTRVNAGTGRLLPGHFLKSANRITPYTLFFINASRTF